MSPYTTGELAKACGVSVRTVQFYDEKALVQPSLFSEGGRRLYAEAELQRLKLVCLLKSFGLSLDTIKGILESDHPEKVLSVLLDEQENLLVKELSRLKERREAIKAVRENLACGSALEQIGDMKTVVEEKKKLKKLHGLILSVGIVMDIAEVAMIVVWVKNGNWIPFAVGMPLVIAVAFLLVYTMWKGTLYICPECGKRFRPHFWEFFWAKHTPKTRKLTCTLCGKHGYCVETAQLDGKQ